ncbi:MAG: metal-dependent hydrolase [Bacillota bacterium]|nr:metal-dependent hydrolase [Bacillota bacterium]
MDPITHAIVGAGIYALAGGDISITQPALLGCVAGSLIPDIDIIAKARNDYYYLKHHRGSSHSLGGIIFLSILATTATALLYGGIDFLPVFAWTFAGAFMHVFLDILNSYGAQVLWPFSRKKYSLSLLGIFDVIVLILGIAAILFCKGMVGMKAAVIAAFGLYISALGIMRALARRRVWGYFKGRVEQSSIKVLPSPAGLLVWDFIAMSRRYSTVGRVYLLSKKVVISTSLRRLKDKEKQKFMDNRVAFFFREFTPLYHIRVKKRKDLTEVVYTDLRYRIRNGFMHHATAVYNPKGTLVECIFHPFSKKRRVPF